RVHRLRRVRTRMPGRGDLPRHRPVGDAGMAGAEPEIRHPMAEHHREEGTTGRRKGLGWRAGQVRSIFQRGARRGLMPAAGPLSPSPADRRLNPPGGWPPEPKEKTMTTKIIYTA